MGSQSGSVRRQIRAGHPPFFFPKKVEKPWKKPGYGKAIILSGVCLDTLVNAQQASGDDDERPRSTAT
jgi:hypothetical protein